MLVLYLFLRQMREAEDLAQMSGEPTSRTQMRQLGELLQRQVQIDQAQQRVEPQVAFPAATQRSSSQLSQERQTRRELVRQVRQLKEQLAQAPVSSRGGVVAPMMMPRQLQVGRHQAAVQRPGMVRPPSTINLHAGMHSLSQQLVSRPVWPDGTRTYAQAVQARNLLNLLYRYYLCRGSKWDRWHRYHQ